MNVSVFLWTWTGKWTVKVCISFFFIASNLNSKISWRISAYIHVRQDTKKSDLHKVNLRQYRVNNTHTRIIASSRCLRMTQLFSSSFQYEVSTLVSFLAFFSLLLFSSLLLAAVDIWQEISFSLNLRLHHPFFFTSHIIKQFDDLHPYVIHVLLYFI
jgi:hypothetical protein